MNITLELPDYDGRATDVIWDEEAAVSMDVGNGEVVLSANRAGLTALAKQMLYLRDLPAGSHVHYDDAFLTAHAGMELIVEKSGGEPCRQAHLTVD